MLLARRLALALGLALIAGAAALLLWPLHANGVSGNALRPHYTHFGWYSYVLMPTEVTRADFARAGIVVPQLVVDHRRLLAAEIAASGALLVISAAVMRSVAATAPKARRRSEATDAP